jgi:hypothetical protein
VAGKVESVEEDADDEKLLDCETLAADVDVDVDVERSSIPSDDSASKGSGLPG